MATMSCCYSKLEELEAELNSDMSFFGTETETEQQHLQQQLVAPDYYYDDNQLLLGFDSNFFSSDTFLDINPPFWEEKSNISHYNNFSLPSTTSSSPPEIFPAANNYCNYEFHDSYNNTMKRQKVYEEEEQSFLNYSDIDFVIPNMSNFFEEPPIMSQEIFVGPFLDQFGSNPLTYYNNNNSSSSISTITSSHHESMEVKKPGDGGGGDDGGGKNLSAQSIAARQRRRKITEKTQELGKLIPGGHRMNTADMFQAAYKYIKFLQAQVGILQILQESNGDSLMDNNGKGIAELLLGSTLIQEKLYSAEKCLVPKKLVDESLLPNHQKKLKLDTDHHHHHHHHSSSL